MMTIAFLFGEFKRFSIGHLSSNFIYRALHFYSKDHSLSLKKSLRHGKNNTKASSLYLNKMDLKSMPFTGIEEASNETRRVREDVHSCLNSSNTYDSDVQSSVALSSFLKVSKRIEVIYRNPKPLKPSSKSIVDKVQKRTHARSVLLSSSNSVEVVYTDGSCLNNGKKRSKAGIGIYWGVNDPRNTSKTLEGKLTNNRAELTAVFEALLQSDQSKELCIYTDSKYVLNSITKWSYKWRQNDWKTANNHPVENKDLMDHILKAIENRNMPVRLRHVYSHKDSLENNEADRLARLGSLKNK